ncbi:hypothetical protein DAEQUDRAFT_152084 [Daedalea quercina L-15889]|uniref:Uncharacterized protein n=1 Tax=Daedalea quercina L-15889 TaxID=1314783 RepID=A0A165RLK8_9APHY|nr:hypothetical protein DAEQUDRAFT_152084 [Daedalea quercina L-15889]
MPAITLFVYSVFLLWAAAFNGKDMILHGVGKAQNLIGAALQSFQLPASSLWDYRPPGSSLFFDRGEFTSTEYLDWYLFHRTTSALLDKSLHNVSSLEWFVEEGLAGSPVLLHSGRDAWFELNNMSPWDDSGESIPASLNATDSRLRCFIELEGRSLSSAFSSTTATSVKPVMSVTSMPESSIARTEHPSATTNHGPTSTARCFVGQEYVASTTGTFALPTSLAPTETPNPAYGPSVPSPTGTVASSVLGEDVQVGANKQDADIGFAAFILSYLERIREFLGVPQHKFYPIIVLPIPALFAWWLDGGFEKEVVEEEADDEEAEEQEVEKELLNGDDDDKQMKYVHGSILTSVSYAGDCPTQSFDAALPSSESVFEFDFEDDGDAAEAGLGPSPPF